MPHYLLALETATDVCSVGLAYGDPSSMRVRARTLAGGRQHDAALLQLASEVLEVAGVARDDLDGIAVSAGPGSYTGLRIGVSAAKGICAGLSLPLVPVPSLPAAALASSREGRQLTAFPSRRGEVFAAIVAVTAGQAEQIGDTMAGPPGAVWEAAAAAGCSVATGPAADRFADLAPEVQVTPADGAAVARLGLRRLLNGETANLDRFEPYYLKEFVAGVPTRSAFARLPF